jgi:hypothetical protein
MNEWDTLKQLALVHHVRAKLAERGVSLWSAFRAFDSGKDIVVCGWCYKNLFNLEPWWCSVVRRQRADLWA